VTLPVRLKALLVGEVGQAGTIMTLRLMMLGSKLLLSVFIARYLSIEELGFYGLIIGVVAVGQIVMRLGIASGLFREAVSMPMPRLIANLRNYLMNCAVLYALIFPIAMGVGFWLEMPLIALLVFCVLITEQLCMDIYTLAINLQRSIFANLLLSIQSSAWIFVYIVTAFFVPELQNLEFLILLWIAAGVLGIGFALWYVRRAFRVPREKIAYRFIWVWERFLRMRDLYVSEVMGVAANFADRFIITFFLGLEMAGVYVLFWQMVNAIVNLVDSAVVQVYRAKFIRAFQAANGALLLQQFYRGIVVVFGLTSAMALAVALLSPVLFWVVDKPVAEANAYILYLLLIASLFRVIASLGAGLLFGCNEDRRILKIAFWRNAAMLPIFALAAYYAGIPGLIGVLIFREVMVMVIIQKFIPTLKQELT